MSKVSQLEPQNVFHFFEEICGIPHGSGNVEKISDYLVDFARERKPSANSRKWIPVFFKRFEFFLPGFIGKPPNLNIKVIKCGPFHKHKLQTRKHQFTCTLAHPDKKVNKYKK